MTRQASPVDGGPAFPRIDHLEPRGMAGFDVVATGGMTLRDYFAAKAMHGFLTGAGWPQVKTMEQAAEFSYEMADAMLAARRATLTGDTEA